MTADEHRLKRLRLRSWRRGMREVDLVLGRFADAALADLGKDELIAYEALLSENDQDVYAWVGGSATAPTPLAAIIERIRRFHGVGAGGRAPQY